MGARGRSPFSFRAFWIDRFLCLFFFLHASSPTIGHRPLPLLFAPYVCGRFYVDRSLEQRACPPPILKLIFFPPLFSPSFKATISERQSPDALPGRDAQSPFPSKFLENIFLLLLSFLAFFSSLFYSLILRRLGGWLRVPP